jgi:adenine-specific DNA-methyltransferase
MQRVETRRNYALVSLSAKTKADLAQFFTPQITSELMASFAKIKNSDAIKILDPGAGSGSLAAAIIAKIAQSGYKPSIKLVAVELDSSLLKSLKMTLSDCQIIAKSAGLNLETEIINGDYLEVGFDLGGDFDFVIMNPPYQKLGSSTKQRSLMTAFGWDSPNLYSAFMAIGIENLAPGGQLISITPRSFANGTYFEKFRKQLLSKLSINQIHLFNSRSSVFSESGVLQENIILVGNKSKQKQNVTISNSDSSANQMHSRKVHFSEIVHEADPSKFIRIPSTKKASLTVEILSSLKSRLEDYGVQVSTGKVVDFRAEERLRKNESRSTIPLIYPGNLKNGIVQHPLPIGKSQWFSIEEGQLDKFSVPSGTYVLIKRFSSKEERRRIVAALWTPTANGECSVAFENKLNYLHSSGEGLDHELAAGISMWLNSTIVDDFFRTFSGHTQVNAADLRSLPFPEEEVLRKLAKLVDRSREQASLDEEIARLIGSAVAAA